MTGVVADLDSTSKLPTARNGYDCQGGGHYNWRRHVEGGGRIDQFFMRGLKRKLMTGRFKKGAFLDTSTHVGEEGVKNAHVKAQMKYYD